MTDQLEKLNALLAALAAGNNRFYAGKLGGLSEVSSLEEFTERVPFTTKQELATDQRQHPPYGTNLTWPLERYHRFHQTSGTSGDPIIWLDDEAGWRWICDNWRWVWQEAGVTAGQAAFFPFSFGPFLGFWAGFESAASLGIRTIPAGGLSSESRLAMMARLRPEVLCCTPTYGLRLAQVSGGIAHDLGVQKLIVAGEPGGSLPAVRARLEDAWQAEVIDHHGMTEVGPVTVADRIHPDRLKVRHDAYFCEVIDKTQDGVGELVLTTLGRYGSPLLRYRTGDLVKMIDGHLVGGILGRSDDMVIVRGVNLYPGAIDEVVRRIPSIVEYQVLVSQRHEMTEISLRIEGAGAQELTSALQQTFSLRIPVEEVPPNILPRYEMKGRRWISG